MQDKVKDLLERRRNRTLAAILGVKDREVDKYLPPEVAANLRKIILDQMNEFYLVVVDILESSAGTDEPLNELFLEKLEEMHNNMERLVASLGPS